MSELKVTLISDKCKDCPRLELITDEYAKIKNHRCEHLQFCREVLGFWKENNRIEELDIKYREEVVK